MGLCRFIKQAIERVRAKDIPEGEMRVSIDCMEA